MAEVKTMADNLVPAPLGGVAAWPARVKEYFNELAIEMRRVTWPARKQVQATTAVVIAAIFLFAAYFAVVDMLLGRAVTQVFKILVQK